MHLKLNFADDEKKRFKAKFIEPGLVHFKDPGIELLRKETIDASLESFKGCGLVRSHKDRTTLGVVDNAYYNAEDGWFYVEGSIDSDEAREKINSGYSVSCGYMVHALGEGGTHNQIKYVDEIKEISFDHLAFELNPRYEEATIRLNGLKTMWKWVTQLVKRENASTPAETILDIQDESEIEIGGKKVKLSELVDSYAKVNGIPTEAVNSQEEKPTEAINSQEEKPAEAINSQEEKPAEEEKPKEEKPKEEKPKEEKPAEAKKEEEKVNKADNSDGVKHFNILANARNLPPVQENTTFQDTLEGRVLRGKFLYGGK